MDIYKRFIEDFTMPEVELIERIRKEKVKAEILATNEYLMGISNKSR